MTHGEIVKEQLLHIVFGTLVFVFLGAIAVALDIASGYVASLGVSEFTHKTLEYTAHGLLLVDIILFVVYIATSSWQLIKEMTK
jgi:hypothetical protein